MFVALFDKGKFKPNHSMEKENSICTRDWGRDWKGYSPMVEFLGLRKHEDGKTMFPTACLSWPDFSALPLYNLQSLCTSLGFLISVTEGHRKKNVLSKYLSNKDIAFFFCKTKLGKQLSTLSK